MGAIEDLKARVSARAEEKAQDTFNKTGDLPKGTTEFKERISKLKPVDRDSLSIFKQREKTAKRREKLIRKAESRARFKAALKEEARTLTSAGVRSLKKSFITKTRSSSPRTITRRTQQGTRRVIKKASSRITSAQVNRIKRLKALRKKVISRRRQSSGLTIFPTTSRRRQVKKHKGKTSGRKQTRKRRSNDDFGFRLF